MVFILCDSEHKLVTALVRYRLLLHILVLLDQVCIYNYNCPNNMISSQQLLTIGHYMYIIIVLPNVSPTHHMHNVAIYRL